MASGLVATFAGPIEDAPTHACRRRIGGLLALALALVLIAVPVASASKGVTTFFGGFGGGGAGQFSALASGIGGIAVNNSSGDVYVADRGNNRIQQFSSSGSFVRAFGYDVVSSGSDNIGVNEKQTVTVNATGGKFSLSMTTANGTGKVTAGSNEVIGVSTSLGGFHVGDTIVSSGNIPIGTKITAVGGATLTLSKNALSTTTTTLTATENTGAAGEGTITEGSSEVTGVFTTSGAFAAGQIFTVNGSGIPTGTTIVSCSPSCAAPTSLVLSASATASGSKTLTANNIAFNTTAGELQTNLEALPGIGSGGVAVGGGPGGTAALTVEFKGLLAGDDVAALSPNSAGLSGGTHTATVATTLAGGGFEICNPATSSPVDVCKAATASAVAGGLSAPQGVAIDQANGNLYVTDQGSRRVDVFSSAGAFEGAFGWKVKVTGAAEELQLCTIVSGCQADVSGAKGGQFAGSLGYPAVDPSSGKVVIADSANRRVDVFVPAITAGEVTGIAFQRAWGFDVISSGKPNDKGTGFEICDTTAATPNAPADCKAGTSGAEPGQFSGTSPTRVAVGNAGSVYAIDPGNNRLQKFDSSGNPQAIFASGQLSGEPAPTDVAVNPTNNRVLVVKPCNSTICPSVAVPSERHVLEFDSVGTLLDTHGANAGIDSVNGLALAPGSGNLYLSSTTGEQRVYVLNNLVPPVPTVKPCTGIGGTTATFEGEINPEGLPTSYRFEYSPDGVTWTKFPEPDATLGFSDSSAHSVSQSVTGLIGSQLYHVRLLATKSFAGGSATSTETTCTTLAEKPAISGEQVSEQTTESAILEAEVNPENEPTTYHFEYTDKTDFEANGYANATEVPMPEGEIEAGSAPVSIVEQIAGLEPDTPYVFRAVATNSAGTTDGVDRNFGTFPDQSVEAGCGNEEVRKAQGSTYLPDCRAFELVNMPDKGNQNAAAELKMTTPPITADGEEMVWNVLGGAPAANVGTGNFLAERLAEPNQEAPNGWESRSIIPPAEEQANNAEFGGYLLEATTPDLSAFIFKTPRTPLSRGHTLVRFDTSQHETVLHDYPNVEEYPEQAVDLTDDGSHVLSVNTNIVGQLEDYGDGSPEVISIMPDGSQNECGLGWPNEKEGALEGRSFVGTGNQPHEGVAALWLPGYHLIDTTDASRVYFQAKPNADELGSPLSCAQRPYALYERNREAPEETILIDEGPGTLVGAPRLARVTPDGRDAYFVTSSKLDLVDSNSENDIYRWDEETEGSECLTCVVLEPKLRFQEEGPASIRISDDFSHIYFESTRELVPGKGTPGDFNLYVLSEGSIKFVADPNSNGSTRGVLERSRLSKDGNVLLFKPENSSSPAVSPHFELTLDELASQCKSAGGAAEGCEELFRYDDRDESLVCVSCQKGGITSNSVGMGGISLGGGPYEMSGDGSTIAFETAERLVPRDVNDSADIYEWRNGKVRLLTSGVTTYQTGVAVPEVMGIDETGRNIFIALVSPGLTGFEQDGLLNLYDVRIGGGFMPPPPQGRCSEESCQGQLQPAPPIDRSASGSYIGPGNPPHKRPCARNKVRRHGRCVARRHKKHHRHNKSRVRRVGDNRGGVK
jgi:hypothetical protein